MTEPSDEEKAREIVWNWRCDCFSHCTRECREKLVAAALRAAREDEREKCAKVADRGDCSHPICHCECRDVAQEIAAAIRARKEESRG